MQHHDGVLLKWRGEGDSTMSVFVNATDACTAAVALQRCLRSEAWAGALTVRTRIALHTGEVEQRDGDYYGATVNRTARIRGLAAGGETLLSRATHDLVADALPADVRLVDVGEYEIKGLRRTENLFLVEAPGLESVTREQPTVPDDLVGRAADIARAVDRIASSGIATITGPGGIGKTRLMREVLARHAPRRASIRAGLHPGTGGCPGPDHGRERVAGCCRPRRRFDHGAGR